MAGVLKQSIPAEDMPRERLAKFGAENLSDSELLAILLRTGSRGNSVLELSRLLIQSHRNLAVLSTKSINELRKYAGIGRDKAVTLLAAFEIARRIRQQSLYLEERKITSPAEVAEYFIPYFQNKQKELFMVVCLNAANRIITYSVISEGILDSSLVHPREVYQIAIQEKAKSIMLIHNHPSGNTEPSQADIQITKKIQEAGKLMDIPVLDHLIIAGNSYTSLLEMRLL